MSWPVHKLFARRHKGDVLARLERLQALDSGVASQVLCAIIAQEKGWPGAGLAVGHTVVKDGFFRAKSSERHRYGPCWHEAEKNCVSCVRSHGHGYFAVGFGWAETD